MLSPELPPWESWSRGTLWGYLTQAFWLFPILCCLKKSLPCPAPPQTPSPCPRTSLWTRPVVRARSSRNVQAAGGLWAAFHLNPWHLQTWPGASRTPNPIAGARPLPLENYKAGSSESGPALTTPRPFSAPRRHRQGHKAKIQRDQQEFSSWHH